jgi:hypothetical protein
MDWSGTGHTTRRRTRRFGIIDLQWPGQGTGPASTGPKSRVQTHFGPVKAETAPANGSRVTVVTFICVKASACFAPIDADDSLVRAAQRHETPPRTLPADGPRHNPDLPSPRDPDDGSSGSTSILLAIVTPAKGLLSAAVALYVRRTKCGCVETLGFPLKTVVKNPESQHSRSVGAAASGESTRSFRRARSSRRARRCDAS